MSVDLPAPFSPMRAWTSPGNSRKSTASSALTPGKVIETPRISTIGDVVMNGDVVMRRPPSSTVGVGGSEFATDVSGPTGAGPLVSMRFGNSGSGLQEGQYWRVGSASCAASGESNVPLGTMMYDSTDSPAS